MEVKEILDKAKSLGIVFGNMIFMDIFGNIKTFSFNLNKLEMALEEGLGFDGSSITGFQDIEDSDLLIKPDLETVMFLDRNVLKYPSVFFLGNIFKPNYEPYEGDSRYILKNILKKYLKENQKLKIGAELEFYFFKKESNLEGLDKGSYFDLIVFDEATKILDEIAKNLMKLGMDIEYYHHEVGDSQFELDIKYNNAEKMADWVIIARTIVKKIAAKYEIYASFMPKPIYAKAGNGLHTHMSIFEGKQNIFSGERGLSQFGQSFLAGVLKYIKEITLITNPIVNSYKRLIPGYEAPVYISWGVRNRSTLVRVPQFNPKKPLSIRIEVRNPDPSSNPYLVYASLLTAGMKGVEEHLTPPPSIEFNIFALDRKEVLEKGIEILPDSLKKAMEYTEQGTIVKDILGEHLFERFLYLKEYEWQKYRAFVTKWEIDNYYNLI